MTIMFQMELFILLNDHHISNGAVSSCFCLMTIVLRMEPFSSFDHHISDGALFG